MHFYHAIERETTLCSLYSNMSLFFISSIVYINKTQDESFSLHLNLLIIKPICDKRLHNLLPLSPCDAPLGFFLAALFSSSHANDQRVQFNKNYHKLLPRGNPGMIRSSYNPRWSQSIWQLGRLLQEAIALKLKNTYPQHGLSARVQLRSARCASTLVQ